MGSCFCTSAHLTPHINMKFLVLSVVLSAATAAPSFLGLVGHPNGAVFPVDEPAVAAARADHLGALAATNGAVIGHAVAAVPAVAAAPVAYAAAPAIAAAAPVVAHGYAGPLNLNTHLVGHPNGAVVPADEPAVAAARADHFAAGGGQVHAAPVVAAPVAAAPVVAAAGYAGPLNLNVQPLVAHPNGAVTPADEPAVAAARAAHLSTKVAAAPLVAAAVPAVAAAGYAAGAPVVAATGYGYSAGAPVVAGAGYAGALNGYY